jgi:hypothetical protein
MTYSIFQVMYQVCKRNDPNVAGPVYAYRKPERQAIVVVEDESAVTAVVTSNITLADGELVDVLQSRRLGQGIIEVFVQREPVIDRSE